MRRLLLFLLCLPIAAHATTRYVAQTAGTFSGGTACNGQTAITPATFNGITLGPGDLTWVCGAITGTAGTTALTIGQNGTNGSPITIKFDTGATLSAPYWSANNGAIDFHGRSWITVDGNSVGTIQNTANGDGLANQHISIGINANSCSNCTIQNLTIANIYVAIRNFATPLGGAMTQMNAISINGSNLFIAGNTIHDCGWCIFDSYGNGDTNTVISGNNIYNWDHAIMFATSGANACTGPCLTISGNKIHDDLNFETAGCVYHLDGLHTFGTATSTMTGIYLFNNHWYGALSSCSTGLIFMEQGSGGGSTPSNASNVNVWNEVFDASGTNGANPNGWVGLFSGVSGTTTIVNNTLLCQSSSDSGTSGWGIQQQGANIVFEGNLENKCGQGNNIKKGSGTLTADYNAYGNPCSTSNNCFVFGASPVFTGSFANWKTACACDSHSQATASDAALKLNLDGSLQAGSPAIGVSINLVGLATGQLATLASDTTLGGGRIASPRPAVAAWSEGAFGLNQTWFVRPDGGTRYSSNVPAGQCDGLADMAYPGSGTNQHCAYKDFRYIWDDDSGVVGLGTWQPVGGDTIVVRGCTANANQVYPSNPNCRIGWDAGVGTAGVNDWCRGVGNNVCTNPTINAGTSGQHTRILAGYAFDHPGAQVPAVNMVQLFGGYGLQLGTFNLAGTQWVDIVGIELTTHNKVSAGNPGAGGNCTKGGSPAFPVDCQGGTQPYDDYAQNGFVTSNTTANILFQDVNVHGFNASAFWGPIGGPITMTRVKMNFNGFAGWNFADQSDTPNAVGSSIIASYVTANGNGCYEQYPIINAFPARACYDSNSGGFGDAWSGQDTTLDTFTCDHCTMMYNTKDAFIGPHAQVGTLTVTNTVSIGNMGAQMKYGSKVNATTLFQNNLFVMNCFRMSETLPGAPQNFAASTGLGGSYLTNFCRAGGDGWAFLTRANNTNHYYGNTIIAANATMMDINCGFVDAGGVHEETNCGTSPLIWKDNNFLGYTDPILGQQPGLWFFDPGAGGSLVLSASFNNYFGVRNITPDICGTNNITCNDPKQQSQPAQPWPGSEAGLDPYNPFGGAGNSFYLSTLSPLPGAGTTLGGLTTDFYATTRSSPPSIGGVEGIGTVTPTVATPTASPVGGSYATTQSVTLASTTSGAAICYTLDGSIPTAVTAGTCDGLIYSTPLSVAVTTTIHAIGTKAANLNSAVAAFAYTITPIVPTTTVSGKIVISGTVQF